MKLKRPLENGSQYYEIETNNNLEKNLVDRHNKAYKAPEFLKEIKLDDLWLDYPIVDSFFKEMSNAYISN